MEPRVAVIVPTADPDAEPASSCLETARRTTAHLNVEVEAVVSSGPDFTFSGSVNEGVHRHADADGWVILNDDCIMDEGWLDAKLDTVEAHPSVGVVGGLLRFPDGEVQHAGARIHVGWVETLRVGLRNLAPLWALRRIRAGKDFIFEHYDDPRKAVRLDYITGACMLVTAACWEDVGPFEEAYPFGAEDADYCLRALREGWELALATQATGVHLEGESWKGVERMERLRDSGDAIFSERWEEDEVRRLTRGRTGVVHPPVDPSP